ncbi:DUF1127 domain-containing protein [Maritimibacter sp. UBA3975]|uniref:DUF1127 domain-containing protein n=1 Tax=Maritimibacter sp. UBA3975 TaxID=1946833 RepID=UPI000C0A019C|nr:DUF1127 domain-containing protein [Maritimibacter sp. UBA3975]MAM60974.1 hypothetical protein [Maritimibacter sp.]|tara:strand:- start:25548 stop:25739 length:192 start_codon:yes stop_codon:yes gene_type:complete
MAARTATYEFAGHVSRVIRFVADFRIDLERRRARRATRRKLETLTDSQLTDIGVKRLDVFMMR